MKKIFLSASFADVAEHFKQFILKNTGEEPVGKSVTFINTASKVEAYRAYVDHNRRAFEALGVIVDEFDISGQNAASIQAKIEHNDYLFIEGGNTFYLLEQLKLTGADQIMIAQILKGKPYIGCSAGSVILAANIDYIQDMDDPTVAPSLNDYNALNIVDFYPLPHYGDEPFKSAAEIILQKYQYQRPIVTMSNQQFIAITGEHTAAISTDL